MSFTLNVCYNIFFLYSVFVHQPKWIWTVNLNTSKYYGFVCDGCNVIKIERRWTEKRKLSIQCVRYGYFFHIFSTLILFFLVKSVAKKSNAIFLRPRHNVFWKSIKCHTQNMAKHTLIKLFFYYFHTLLTPSFADPVSSMCAKMMVQKLP